MRMILDSGTPAILFHSFAASSSSAKTVIRRRFGSSAEVLGEQLPGEQDRALLEIIAEGEIAEHLEEGVVARGVAHIVEVVVLAAGAHAFLRRRRAQEGGLLGAGEHVLERHHAGIGEHQRRIVARHQRARGHHLVIVLGKEVEESRTDIVGAGVAPSWYGPTLRSVPALGALGRPALAGFASRGSLAEVMAA